MRRTAPIQIALLLCAVTVSLAAGADDQATPALRRLSMRIQQQIDMGDLAAGTDYRCEFQGACFRIEGGMRLTKMEMDIRMTITGDGVSVRQLSDSPIGIKAYTIDLRRVQTAIPEYDPSRTYDPSVYQKMLDESPDKKPLDAITVDGVKIPGFEIALPEGRLSFQGNVSLGLPDPAKARLWVSPADHIARRVELEDAQGRTYLRTTYSDLKWLDPAPAERFVLAWPKEVAPLDITDLILGGATATRRPPEGK